MTDITAELAALPKKPNPEDYCNPSVDKQAEAIRYAYAHMDYIEARLAIAEWCLNLAVDGWTNNARAYLAHRAKEQP